MILLNILHRYNRLILVLTLICSGSFCLWIGDAVTAENSIYDWFDRADVKVKGYEDFRVNFGNDEVALVSVSANNIADVLTIGQIELLTASMEAVPGVARVVSATNLDFINPDSEVKLLFRDWHNQSLAVLGVQGHEALRGFVVSEDGQAIMFWVFLEKEENLPQSRTEVFQAIQSRIYETTPKVDAALSGMTVMFSALNASTTSEFWSLLGKMALVLLVILIVLMNFSPVVFLISIAMGCAVLTTMGSYGLAGGNLNTLMILMPSVIILLGVTDAIHFPYAQMHFARLGKRGRDLTLAVIKRCFIPCLMTTMTTVVSLLSLLTSPVLAIQNFGLFTAMGVLLAFVVTIIAMANSTNKTRNKGRTERPLLGIFLGRLSETVNSNSRTIIFISGLVVIGCIAPASLVKFDSNMMDYIDSDSDFMTDKQEFDSQWGEYIPLSFVLSRVDNEAITTWEFLQKQESFFQRTENEVGFRFALGLSSFYRWANHLFFEDGYKLSKDAFVEMESYASEISGPLFPSYLSPDLRQTQFVISVPYLTGSENMALQAKIIEIASAEFGEDYIVESQGLTAMHGHLVVLLAHSQFRNIALGVALTAFMLLLWVRSAFLFTLGMVPSLMTLLVLLAVMGGFAIPLEMTTLVSLIIVVGVSVDDSIHIVHHWRDTAAQGISKSEVLRSVFEKVGPPATATSILIGLGSLVFFTSDLAQMRFFGILLFVGNILAWLMNLVLLPVILKALKPERQSPVLGTADSWKESA